MFPFYRFYICQLTDRLKYILHTPKEMRSQGSDIVGGFASWPVDIRQGNMLQSGRSRRAMH
jgi:hypothetical protein